MHYLKQSTAVTLKIGPFLDDTDGKTAETGLTITQADIRLSKNGANIAQKTEATACTHDEIGVYGCPIDATDTATLGCLQLWVYESGALPVFHEYMVVTANFYDSLFSTDKLQVDAVEISGDSAAADNLELDYDGTGYAKANSTIGTCTTNTDMVGTANAALAATALTNATWTDAKAAFIDASIQTVDTVVDGIQTDLSNATDGLGALKALIDTVDGVVDAILVDTGTTLDGKINTIDGVVDAILLDTGTDGVLLAATATSAQLIDDVWDELLTGAVHNIATSAGRRLREASDLSILRSEELAQGGTISTITLNAAASAQDLFYNTAILTITDGTGVGQARTIDQYTGATRVATICRDWVIAPDNTSKYMLRSTGCAAVYTIGTGALALINTECDTALTDYDPPTNTEMVAAFTEIKGGTWAAGTDTLEHIRNKETDIETDTAEIGVAGAGLTGLGGMSVGMKAEVESEANDALVAQKLDHLVAVADADDAVNDSIIAKLAASDGDWSGFSNASDSLEAIRDRGDAAWTTGAGGSDRLLMVDTTIAALASQTSFTLTAGSTDDNAYNNCTIIIEDVATATQKAMGIISNYAGATKTITLKYDPAIFAMAPTDKVYILAENALKSTLANRQLNVAADGDIAGNIDGSVASVVGHTAQTGDGYAIVNHADYGNSKLVRSTTPANKLDVAATGEAGLDFANIKNAAGAHTLTNITVPTVTTLTGHTAQTGDNYTRLGAPAGASIAADLVTIDNFVDDLESRLTAARAGYLDELAAANLPTDIADIPTVAEFNARTIAAAAYFDPAVDSVIVGTNNDKTGYALSAAGIDSIFDELVEGALAFRQIMRILLSMAAEKSTGGGTATITFRDHADTKARITATVDANGNRTAITLDGA